MWCHSGKISSPFHDVPKKRKTPDTENFGSSATFFPRSTLVPLPMEKRETLPRLFPTSFRPIPTVPASMGFKLCRGKKEGKSWKASSQLVKWLRWHPTPTLHLSGAKQKSSWYAWLGYRLTLPAVHPLLDTIDPPLVPAGIKFTLFPVNFSNFSPQLTNLTVIFFLIHASFLG